MMKQYHSMRQALPPDVILMFRLGDFYEMFFEDAKTAAGILRLTLTSRNGIPMCGVPYHAAQGYLRQLVRAGKRVAIAEQTAVPVAGKITPREVTQVISAGTVNDVAMIAADRPLYLAAVFETGKKFGLAFVDHTTGEFRLTEFDEERSLHDELARITPAEVLYSPEQLDKFSRLDAGQVCDAYAFLFDQAVFTLKDHFKVQSLDGYGCGAMKAAVGAAGAILFYLRQQLQRKVDHIRRIQPYQTSAQVILDAQAQQHLELVNSRSGREATLVGALDRTQTPMGARLLRDWVLRPLRDLSMLKERQDLIGALVDQPSLLAQVREALKGVRDVERTVGRLSQGGGNGRDMLALGLSLKALPELNRLMASLHDSGTSLSPALAGHLASRLRAFDALVEEIECSIVEEPGAMIKDGGIFRDGSSAALDELRQAANLGKDWIAQLQADEITKTGIKSLKVKYNSVFGYFIEITKSNLSSVPPHYHRKQTTANGERFITPELKTVEDKILGAEERAKKLEYELFQELRGKILAHVDEIQDTAAAVAALDVISSLAETAKLYAWTRPLLNDSLNLYIKNGRHPVLDQQVGGERFVPNDTAMEPEQARLHLITGPNMAGKSTYIRQVALLTLLAQIGSFLPAETAEIGLVDRIFTRVGASDDLSKGQSTFMVEMNETSLIINNATERSLVILDEIGRGTSTFDGLSLAWAIAEHMHDTIKARTLFATHYHELTTLAKSRPGVQNWNVAVREWNDQVIFLRKIVHGAADKSYGIHVARLAGLPDSLISRAKEVLSHLEAQSATPDHDATATESAEAPTPTKRSRKAPAKADLPEARKPQLAQLELF